MLNSAPAPQVSDRDLDLVRSRIGRAVGRAGLTGADRDDLSQHALVELCRRAHRYDAGRGPRDAFVANVALNAVANVVERRCAAKRDWRRCRVSLDDEVLTASGSRLPRVATVADDEHAVRTRGARLGPVERADLRLDMATVLAGLPERRRRVCWLLMRLNPTDAAWELGIARGTLHEIVRRIREEFERAGLDAYVNTSAGGRR